MAKTDVSLPGFSGTINVEFTPTGEIKIAGKSVGQLHPDGKGYEVTGGSAQAAMLTESLVAQAFGTLKPDPPSGGGTSNPPFGGGGQIPL